MEYQELYSKYQQAIKLRELAADKNFLLLKDIFRQKIIDNISFSAKEAILPYLAGIKEVFNFVESEAEKVGFYRDELDKMFQGENK